MAYSDFTFDAVLTQFELREVIAPLFPVVMPMEPSAWLRETLALSQDFGLLAGTEKARSEFIVAPILLELRRSRVMPFAIYSGRNLEGDRALGLNGECDFLLSRGETSYSLHAPLFAIVEAKKQDLDLGLGQCAAQLVGARMFNQKRKNAIAVLYGCVTTGDNWLFLKLENDVLMVDSRRYFYSELDLILGLFNQILLSLES
jgi:hypothetical protein